MIWLKENLGNIITIIVLLGLIGICIRSLYRHKRSGSCGGCSKNCATCALRYAHGMADKK